MDELEQLYRKYASDVFRFAWGLCGNRAGAEDIVSETFVRLIARAPRVATRTARAYLLTIARNIYLTERRRTPRLVPVPDDIPARESDPAERMDHAARLVVVTRALSKLPEGERAALLLRVDHGLAYDEIAAALNTSVAAAKVRVHRARQRLMQELESEGLPL